MWKFQEVPIPCGPEDVKRCETVVQEMTSLSDMVQKIIRKLKGRRDELYIDEIKLWQINEGGYVNEMYRKMKGVDQNIDEITNNVNHVYGILKGKFDAMNVRVAEKKRISMRQKEYQKQKRRRQKKAALRKASMQNLG